MKRNINIENYFQGQIKDIDDIPAVPSTFKRKENKEYQQLMEKFIREQKKILVLGENQINNFKI